MNRQLVRLFGVTAAGFVLLLGFTTYWQLWASSSLAARQDNLHEVVREQSIDRGRILAANGEVLAKSVARKTADGRRIYVRRYPHGPVFAHVTGYSSPTLEPQRSRAVAERLPDRLELGPLGRARARVPLDHRRRRQGQRRRHLARSRGAVGGLQGPQGRPAFPARAVALEPSTGKVVALSSWPTYNPNAAVLGTAGLAADALRAERRAAARPRDAGPLPAGLDVQGDHAAAALASGKYTPTRRFTDTGHVHRVRAGDPQRQRRALPARSTSAIALTNSINTIFAQIGSQLCPRTTAARCCRTRCPRFGMYRRPQIDLPSNQVLRPASPTRTTRASCSPHDGRLDPARTAIGQYTLEVDAAADGDGRRGDRERRRA